jgi:hypothetical protein
MSELSPAMRIMRMHLEAAAEGNSALLRLLELSVGRVAEKADKRRTESFTIDRPFREIDHIVDWLKAALINNAPWLRNLDAEGRPKKLMKFGTLDAIRREADKDMLRRARQAFRSDLPPNSEEVVATLEGGYTVVRLLTVEALDAESAEMHHCVGDGAYDESLSDGNSVLLSLRDPNGKAHATIEIVDNLVEQVQGKQNRTPAAKYLPLLVSFFNQTNYVWEFFGDGSEGFVIDVNGVVHSCDDLPDELHAHGSVVLRSCAKMPSVVTARGDITVHCLEHENPPLRLVSGRDINLLGRGFKTCPELELKGSLTIQHTGIKVLPSGLTVDDLFVSNTPLEAVPEDLRCKGRIGLTWTNVKSLPPGLWNLDGGKVSSYGSVDLCASPVSNLGGLDTVHGSLCLNWTNIKTLPANFTVAGSLSCRGLKDLTIGPGLSARHIGGEDSNVHFLGDSLTTGRIHLENCGVTFPTTVRCESMDLKRVTIVKLPDSIECGQRLKFASCFSEGLPKRIRAKALWFHLGVELANVVATLDGDIVVDTAVFEDRKIRLGTGFKADLVAVSGFRHLAEMVGDLATEYLGEHAGKPGAMEQFAEEHGIELSVQDVGRGVLPGSTQDKLAGGFGVGFE